MQGARRISGAFEYAADLFHSDQVERLAKQFERLVEQAMAEPEGAVGQVDVLDVEERRRVLTEFNRTASASAAARSPAEWLTEAAQQYGDRVALEDGAGLRWSYDQLHKRAALLAGHLATLGAGPDRIVGICLDRSAEMVLALLAVVKSGAAYLPVEPDWPAAVFRRFSVRRPQLWFSPRSEGVRRSLGSAVRYCQSMEAGSIIRSVGWKSAPIPIASPT